jgi:hypothetical protein
MSSIDSDSDVDNYFSPDEHSTPKPENHPQRSSKETLLEISTSSESPENSVQTGQGKFVKVLKPTDSNSETTDNMNEITQKFLENLICKSEERVVAQITKVQTDICLVKKELIDKVCKLERQLHSVKMELEKTQSELRKKNILVEGIPEKDKEKWNDTEVLIEQLFNQLGLSGSPIIDDCFRIGTYKPGKIRPILLKFVRFKDKKLVMENRNKLKGTKIYLNDDLTKDQRIQNSILWKKEKELRRNHPGAKVYSRTCMLFLNEGSRSVKFTVNEDHTIKETTTNWTTPTTQDSQM